MTTTESSDIRPCPPKSWQPSVGDVIEIIAGPYSDLIGVVREQVWPESWAVDLGYPTPLVFDLTQMRLWRDET